MKAIAQYFKALSDETRLRILSLLTTGELCVCDLMAVLDLPQSTVSRHLAYLRNTGLVEDRRQGIWMYYRLAKPSSELPDFAEWLPERLAESARARQDRALLQNYLTHKDPSTCE